MNSVADIAQGSALLGKFRFTSYTALPQRLKGQHPEVVSEVLESIGSPAAVTVATEFVNKHSDDALSALDPALLHRLNGLVTDPAERARVQKALTRSLAEAGTRSAV